MLIPPRVHPTETSQGPQVEEASDTCSLFLQSYRTWQRLQVSYYGGKYSMERVFALEAYARTTSISRVLMVCFGTPIPMVILVVLQELIPLQDPSEGWQANYGFWNSNCHFGLRCWPHSHGSSEVYDRWSCDLCDATDITVGLCSSDVYRLCGSNCHIPVPFCVLTMAPVFYTFLIIVFDSSSAAISLMR
ncbi:hypothetical protein GQ600_24084 [Phytophthora cactorum]|nr:hypothetical protein GQ600_24084 [Phytophthora cactorum]